ncbi:MAG: conjugal transfer protein TraR [Ignavibacteriaceae bacterium]|jgi:DnaK suppressor protein|nr:MAG: TraR/DksA family transcriptional regulator [Chlorobi bacterium OLB4]MBV6398840.1 RNA polymerase-binding transcription factor DksA [Ignavibacteria bacterium]MEB2329507.1 conjugal transfer protein TraR [Ignavibacteriaceae bacterium]
MSKTTTKKKRTTPKEKTTVKKFVSKKKPLAVKKKKATPKKSVVKKSLKSGAITKKSTAKKPVAKKTAKQKSLTKKTSIKKSSGKGTVVKKKASAKISGAGKKLNAKPKQLTKKVKKTSTKKTISKVKEKLTIPVETRASRKNRKPKKLKYTEKELLHFKEILLNERNRIIESAMANRRSLVDDESGEYVGDNQTYASHMAEQGSDEMEREKNYMFVQRDEKYLGYLNEALLRIDLGTYGICIDCAETPKLLCNTCPLIPKERLELVPITQHCIECKNLRG